MVKRPKNRYSDLGDMILDKINFDSILGSHTLLEFQIPCGFLLLTRRSVDFGMYVLNCPNRGSVTKKIHYCNEDHCVNTQIMSVVNSLHKHMFTWIHLSQKLIFIKNSTTLAL